MAAFLRIKKKGSEQPRPGTTGTFQCHGLQFTPEIAPIFASRMVFPEDITSTLGAPLY